MALGVYLYISHILSVIYLRASIRVWDLGFRMVGVWGL